VLKPSETFKQWELFNLPDQEQLTAIEKVNSDCTTAKLQIYFNRAQELSDLALGKKANLLLEKMMGSQGADLLSYIIGDMKKAFKGNPAFDTDSTVYVLVDEVCRLSGISYKQIKNPLAMLKQNGVLDYDEDNVWFQVK